MSKFSNTYLCIAHNHNTTSLNFLSQLIIFDKIFIYVLDFLVLTIFFSYKFNFSSIKSVHYMRVIITFEYICTINYKHCLTISEISYCIHKNKVIDNYQLPIGIIQTKFQLHHQTIFNNLLFKQNPW